MSVRRPRRRLMGCVWPALYIAAPALAEPPLLRTVVNYSTPGSRTLNVHHSLQHVRGDSLDLVRHAPLHARVPRLEAQVVTETHAVYPRQVDPEHYRIRLLRGAPTDWTLDAELRVGPDAANAVGPDYVCVWLGGVLALPQALPSPAELTLAIYAPPGGQTFMPWPSGPGAARVRLHELPQDFVAAGAWRAYGRMLGGAAPACSLVTCIAGDWPVPDAEWEKLALALSTPAPNRGLVLMCIAPAAAAGADARNASARLWRGNSSALLLCPVDPEAVSRALSRLIDERRLIN